MIQRADDGPFAAVVTQVAPVDRWCSWR